MAAGMSGAALAAPLEVAAIAVPVWLRCLLSALVLGTGMSSAALAVLLEVAVEAAMGDPVRIAVGAMMGPATRDPSLNRTAAMLPRLQPGLPARKDPSIRMVALLPWLQPGLPAQPPQLIMWRVWWPAGDFPGDGFPRRRPVL